MASRSQTAPAVCLIVPGDIETLTGGYVYDRRILAELAASGWQTRVVGLDASFPTPTSAALADALDRIGALPDGQLIVIDGLALAGLLPILPSIVSRLDAIALLHHPLADETGMDAGLARTLEAAEKSALAAVSQVIVTSPWTRRRLADYGVAAERIAVVEPGVDRYNIETQERGSDDVRLLCVATITPRKGHTVLVDALARLADLDWSLRLAGSPGHDPRHAALVRARIEAAGLADRITWLGELAPERVAREYAGADLFVLPSFLEGYGMALAEAIAYGVPVVSTTAGAIPDTVPARAARLVPPGDVEALTAALANLIGDATARAELTRAAREAAASVPTWRDSARRFADVLTRHARR